MKFTEVLAISGRPGLFKYLAQGKSGIIVESLSDGNRFQVDASSKVSTLADIAIYTEAEDMPLSEVFQTISDKLKGGAAIDHKSQTDKLAEAFEEYVPSYDKYRVRASDIKKVFSWYNTLQAAGLSCFVEEEVKEEVKEEIKEESEKGSKKATKKDTK